MSVVYQLVRSYRGAAGHGGLGRAGASLPVRGAAPRRDRLPDRPRLRLTGCQIRTVSWDGMWTPSMVQATLWSPGRPVALRLVHTLAAFPAYWRESQAALAAVSRSVRASGDSRMLMVGTSTLRGQQGIRPAARRGRCPGQADGKTWPNGAIVPSFVRIDHVLIGARLAVTEITARPGFGSDRRYLTATVVIRT